MKSPDGPADDATIPLHLDRFAPGQPEAVSPADDSVTVFIKRAAAETAAPGQQPVVVPKDASALPPQEMLGAVSYCYAKGVFDSNEIEQRMHDDPALHAAAGSHLPSADAIRRFRRLNREAIRQTLETAFRFIRRKRPVTLGTLKESAPLPPGSNSSPPPPGEITVLMAHKEAEQRLEQAMFVDNMSKTD